MNTSARIDQKLLWGWDHEMGFDIRTSLKTSNCLPMNFTIISVAYSSFLGSNKLIFKH